MTTLYRKWRPQRFADVRGQERVVRTLRNALAAGRVGHAYLFCGPRGVGKTTTARLLAKAVNCRHDSDQAEPDGGLPIEPDNTCSICRQITEGRSLDVVEIDAASNGRVDDARDLRDQINFAPNEARYKFYIIDEAHQITKDAFDALLKTFEEPPPHVIFVLATTDPGKVPPTILSRCQRLDFRRLSVADIRASLADVCAAEGITAEPAALELLARSADGSSRDSLSLLDQAIAFCGQSLTLDGIRGMLGLASAETIERLGRALLDGDARSGLELINEASEAGVEPRELNRELVEHLRRLLLLKVSADSAATLDVSPEALPDLRQTAATLDASILVRQIRIFSEADYGFRSALQAQLPLELALLQAIETARSSVERSIPLDRPAGDASLHAFHDRAKVAGRASRPSSGQPASPDSSGPGAQPRGRAASSALAPAGTFAAHARAGSPAATSVEGTSTGTDHGEAIGPQELAGSVPRPSEEPAAGQQASQVAGEGALPDDEPSTMSSGPTGEAATLQTIRDNWLAVRQSVRGQSKNVEALLNSCLPVAFEGASLTLECEAEFHVKKLLEPQNKQLVQAALSRVAGRPCYVNCVVRDRRAEAANGASSAAEAAKPDEDDPLVRAALRMLNARVLE